MAYQLTYAAVRHQSRQVIHVVRNNGEELPPWEIGEVIDRVRERMLARLGEQDPAVVFIQGMTRETLRYIGDAYAVSLVRAALFNAAVRWSPIELG
jgi:hypothetical protein